MQNLENSRKTSFEECLLFCFTLQDRKAFPSTPLIFVNDGRTLTLFLGRNLPLILQVHLAFQPSYSTAVTTNFLSDATKCIRHHSAACEFVTLRLFSLFSCYQNHSVISRFLIFLGNEFGTWLGN